MGGSGDPAQTNIIAAHGARGPDGGRTAGGQAANQFDLQRQKYQFGANGARGAPWGLCSPSRRPAGRLAGGKRRADGKSPI